MIHTDFFTLNSDRRDLFGSGMDLFFYLHIKRDLYIHTYICFALQGRVSSILYIATANSLAAGMRT
jgi:hypothetical protein